MHCLVVGVNGVGKSTMLREVSERRGIPVLHATTELMKFMGMPLEYDRLRAMDQEAVLQQWELTVAELSKQYAGKPYLLDGHIMNLIEGTFIRRDGPWVGLQDALIMLKASPETILERQSHDVSRNRDLYPPNFRRAEKLALLEEYQNECEALFHVLAKQYKLKHEIIMIEQRTEAVDALVAFINANS